MLYKTIGGAEAKNYNGTHQWLIPLIPRLPRMYLDRQVFAKGNIWFNLKRRQTVLFLVLLSLVTVWDNVG